MAEYINTIGMTLTISSLSVCLTSMDFGLFEMNPKIDTTCFGNTEWKTAIPAILADVPDLTAGFNLDPAEVPTLLLEKGVNQLISITFSDATTSTLSFWGYLSGVNISAGQVDGLVTGSLTITATNTNGSDVETGPTFA